MSELFVSPAQKRKLKDKGMGSSIKRALDMRPSGGFYSDDPRGFGEFEDPRMGGDRDELSLGDDHDELDNPSLDYAHDDDKPEFTYATDVKRAESERNAQAARDAYRPAGVGRGRVRRR